MTPQHRPGPIVVTGATGNVGGALVRLVAARGHDVRAAGPRPARPADARFDFADPSTFAASFAGARALFLMRPPQLADPAPVNAALDAALDAGVRRVAFLSIQGAEHNPLVPHYRIERHLMRRAEEVPGLAVTLLRAAFFMQNLTTTHAADVRERGEVFVPAGGGRTAFVDARDVAAAAARVLAGPGRARGGVCAYELTGREALTYDEVAAALTRVLGRRVVYARPVLAAFYARMRARGHPSGFVLVMCALYTTARLGLAGRLRPDLEWLLGRAPVGFERFAREHASAWR